MAKYVFKYWFEFHCNTPLWPENDLAYNIGVPIPLEKLNISSYLKDKLILLCESYDSYLNWDDPKSGTKWTENEVVTFNNMAKSLYNELCEELGDDYEILYCHDENEKKFTTLPVYERLISNSDREYYSHMLEILQCLNLPKDNLCLITDVEHNINDWKIASIFNKDYCILSIEELIKLLEKDDFQWNWGCISIFDKSISRIDILSYDLPNGYENSDIFLEYPIIQHPYAEIEINAFDSNETVFVTKKHEYFEKMKKLFPKYLTTYIKR